MTEILIQPTLLDEQLAFVPKIEGERHVSPVVVCGGMGGSALPAMAARMLGVAPYVIVHRDYGLPMRLLPGSQHIAISYSGNTEETLSFAQESFANGLPLSVITSGGALLEFAKANGLTYVQVPIGVEPRDALISMTKALLALMGETALIGELSGATFVASSAEQDGQALGSALGSALPIFYASTRNELLAYFAKIHCNESAKIPAFCNVVPELNHNEMQGFVGGAGATARTLVQPLIAVFFRDASDDAREQRRMGLTKALLGEQGIRTVEVVLPSEHRTQTFLYGTWLARAAARALAERYSVPPDETPLIAAFKAQL